MKRLPIDLALKTVSTKVSVDAWARAQMLKEKFDVRLSDVISAALLYFPEEDMERVVREQSEIFDNLPKSVKGLMRNVDKLTPEERTMLKDLLS